MSLRMLSVCLLALLLGSACIPPEPEEDVVRNFDRETTVMGRIQAAGTLRVGVPNVTSPWARDLGDLTSEGFAVDIGTAVADALGVQAVFLPRTTEEMIDLVELGALDLAFPLLPITEKAARRNAITDPYFVSHQRLLAPPEVASVEDLTGEVACLLAGAAVGIPEGLDDPPVVVPLDAMSPDVETIEPEAALGYAGCADRLLPQVAAGARISDGVLAATGLDVDLMALHARLETACQQARGAACGPDGGDPILKITGEQLSTAGLGALVTPGASGWLSFVESVFADYEADGDWVESYEEWLTPYLGAPPDPPTITVEEAAALFPKP